MGSEVIVHDIGEVLYQEIVHHRTDIGRDELTFLASYHLFLLAGVDLLSFQRVDGIRMRLSLFVALLHITSLLYCAYRRRIGRRASDAELLELLHKACLRESERRLAEPLQGGDLIALHDVAAVELRQYVHRFLARCVLVVRRLTVHFQESVE